jgi:hypothetical protein
MPVQIADGSVEHQLTLQLLFLVPCLQSLVTCDALILDNSTPVFQPYFSLEGGLTDGLNTPYILLTGVQLSFSGAIFFG